MLTIQNTLCPSLTLKLEEKGKSIISIWKSYRQISLLLSKTPSRDDEDIIIRLSWINNKEPNIRIINVRVKIKILSSYWLSVKFGGKIKGLCYELCGQYHSNMVVLGFIL